MPPLISSVLELDILPRDKTWEAATLADAVHAIETSTESGARSAAARRIIYLGTRQELAHAVNDNLPIRVPAPGKVSAVRKGPRRERGAPAFATAVPDMRRPIVRAIEDTGRLP